MLHRAAIAAWPILQQSAAAVLAWVLAVDVVGHEDPFFAPVAAVVALNQTLGRRGSNALRLLLGVAVGIVVGEVALLLLGGGGVAALASATFTAMAVARAVDPSRIVVAQAAVSAILVTAFGDADEGLSRLVDALVGAGVALVFSQVLFSPEPLRLLRRAESAVLSGMAGGLRRSAEALEDDDQELAAQALDQLRALRDRLADLGTARKASDRIARHSAAWRSRRVPVVRERESADHLDLLASSCILLARTAFATTPQQRGALVPGVRELAEAMADLAAAPGDHATRQRAAERALELARWVVEHGAAVPAQSPMAAACGAVRMVAVDVMVFAGAEAGQALDAVHSGLEDVQVTAPAEPPRRRWRRLSRPPRRPRPG